MKTIIKRNTTTPTGFSLTIINDDGTQIEKSIDKVVDDGKTLALPENPSNRKYWSIQKMEGKDELELTQKDAAKTSKGPKKSVSRISFTEKDLKALPAEIADTVRKAYDMLSKDRERNKLLEMKAKIEEKLKKYGVAE